MDTVLFILYAEQFNIYFHSLAICLHYSRGYKFFSAALYYFR